MITAVLETPEGDRLSAQYDHDGHDSDALLVALHGWAGGVGVRQDSIDRLGHGSFPTPSFRTGRTITLKVLFERDTRGELLQLERDVSGLFHDGGYGSLTVIADSQELSCSVCLDGDVKPVVHLDGGYIEAEIPLKSPDPWLYSPFRESILRPVGAGVGLEYPLFSRDLGKGPVLTFGTAVDTTEPVWNDGNATSYPRFVITADAPGGFAITLNGKRVAFPWPVFSDSPVVVDMSGSVTVSGVDQSHLLSDRGWSGVEPGGVAYPSFDLLRGGTGWATVQHRDTYI